MENTEDLEGIEGIRSQIFSNVRLIIGPKPIKTEDGTASDQNIGRDIDIVVVGIRGYKVATVIDRETTFIRSGNSSSTKEALKSLLNTTCEILTLYVKEVEVGFLQLPAGGSVNHKYLRPGTA